MGPLPFVLFINDLVTGAVQVPLNKFADDVDLHSVVRYLTEHMALSDSIQILSNWSST